MNSRVILSSAATLVLLTAQLCFTSRAVADPEGVPSFYTWNASVPSVPGKLLRSEPLEASLLLENASAGTRILYASEGFSGAAVAVSGAVFLPKGEAPESGWPVLAWSHGTVGVADICAPSFQGRSDRDVNYLNQWLAAGYAIVATDYEGLGTAGTHPYLHCKSEANGNIDAVHAAHELGAPLSQRWMVTGQSQGGQGALCTGAYINERESDLEFLGTLATAPGVNFMQRFEYSDASEPNPYIGIVLLLGRGMETYEPTFKPENAFTEQSLSMMPYTDSMCVMELMGMGMKAGLTTGESLKVIPFSETPGIAAAAKQMEIPETGWSHPIYIAQGTKDELVRHEDVFDFSHSLCEEGAELTLEVYPGADHSGPLNQGVEKFIQWVDDRFAGEPANDNCEMVKRLVE